MRNWIKKHYESWLILLAAKVLDRNVARSKVINRRDNNSIFEIEFELRAIAKRIRNEYSEV